MTEWLADIVYDEAGLVPAIIQDAGRRKVLTLAYMNETSLKKTVETGETWFYSRSRQELWHKGETSGNTQKVRNITWDCDKDALLVMVEKAGPACHTGAESCFSETVHGEKGSTGAEILKTLENAHRRPRRRASGRGLHDLPFEKGVDKILKKVGEEASEVIIAAKNRDPEELKWETADLFYHVLVSPERAETSIG